MKTEPRPLLCTTPTPEGFHLPCPSCGEDCNFAVNLCGLEDSNAFACDCGAEFSFDYLRRLVNVWASVLDRVGRMAALLSADLDALGEDGLPAEAAGKE